MPLVATLRFAWKWIGIVFHIGTLGLLGLTALYDLGDMVTHRNFELVEPIAYLILAASLIYVRNPICNAAIIYAEYYNYVVTKHLLSMPPEDRADFKFVPEGAVLLLFTAVFGGVFIQFLIWVLKQFWKSLLEHSSRTRSSSLGE